MGFTSLSHSIWGGVTLRAQDGTISLHSYTSIMTIYVHDTTLQPVHTRNTHQANNVSSVHKEYHTQNKVHSLKSPSQSPFFPCMSTLHISPQPMRRVSWSDSTLVVQHTYPKYTYDDYDDMQEVKEGQGEEEGSSVADGGGGQVLELPVHPMLQTTKANRDMYSTQPSTPQSTNLHNYKPSIIASYGSLLEDHLNDKGYLSGTGDSKEAASSVPTSAAKGANDEDKSDQPANNAYSAEVAALIW